MMVFESRSSIGLPARLFVVILHWLVSALLHTEGKANVSALVCSRHDLRASAFAWGYEAPTSKALMAVLGVLPTFRG